MGQYDWLFFQFPKEETHSGGMLPPVQAYFRGENSVPGSQVTLPYRAYLKPGVIDDEPHYHREEEYLAFVGHDLRDAFDSFDAEIVFYMGEDLDDMEKIVIDKPTMIKVPGLFWHGPLEIVRLGKPLFFQPVLLSTSAMTRRGGPIRRPSPTVSAPASWTAGRPAPSAAAAGKGRRNEHGTLRTSDPRV